jgi:hypothetical protein
MKWICRIPLTPEHRIVKILLAGGLFLGLLILFIVPPANLPFTCVFHSITGHSCLTCGMTRSLHAITNGDLIASFRYHLFGPVVFVGMLFCFIIFAVEAISGIRFAIFINRRIRTQVAMLLALIWFVYWGARLAVECTVAHKASWLI